MKNTTILIKSFLRFDCLHRLLMSIRRLYPDIPIVVGDDSVRSDSEYDSFPVAKQCQSIYGVEWIRYPFDSGLSYVRNRMIEDVQSDRIILLDDDFVVTDESKFENLLNVLDENKDIAISAGLVRHRNGYAYNWTGEFSQRESGDGKVIVDVQELSSMWELTKKGVWFRRSHLVYNFFAARREFLLNHKWDDEIKIVAEHLEYFLRLFKDVKCPLPEYPVAYTPNSIVFNTFDMGDDTVPKSVRYRTYRGRVDYREHVIKKHNLRGLPGGLAKLEKGVQKRNFRESITVPSLPTKQLDNRNVIIMGVGHSGTTMMANVLRTLGWNLGDQLDEKFAEHSGVRQVNISLCNNPNFNFPAPACKRMLADLKSPWAIKDPRFVFTLDQWKEVLKEYDPILLWIYRNTDDVKESYRTRNQLDRNDKTNIKYMISQGAFTIEDVLKSCREQYDKWSGDKIKVSYERICDASLIVSNFLQSRRNNMVRTESKPKTQEQVISPSKGSILIPKILHQIWLQGEEAIPTFMWRWMNTFTKHHPGWETYIWSEEKILKFLPPSLRKVYDRLQYPSQKADFAGYCIVREYGGIRADTDYEFFRSIEPIIMECRAFVSFVRGQSPVCAGIYGAVKGHPFLTELVAKVSNMRDFSNRNIIGPSLVSDVVLKNRDVRVIECSKLMPISWRERERLKEFDPSRYGNPIAVHHYRQNPRIEFMQDMNKLECIHRENRVIETIGCGTCGGNVKVKVFPCKVHGRCTLSKRIGDMACCASCDDYSR